jgi:hypothetical protein
VKRRSTPQTAEFPNVDRVYRTWDEALGNKDVDAALGLYGAEATIESPLVSHLLGLETGVCQGRAQLRHFIEMVFQRTPTARKRYRNAYFTDGKTLMWEYPHSTPEGGQMDFVEVMEISDAGFIEHHRVYWGWFGFQVLQRNEYHREDNR